jgi:serine phosphatase RsbU (regulator of sigma subunit)
MLQVPEDDIDRLTGLFASLLKGDIPAPLVLPPDYPDNELKQVVTYANRFVTEYRALAGAVSSMSRGDLDVNVPVGRMHLLQSFKNLHANLRHLTWKTQQIAGGDFTQQVDFMGDFSKAFNSMTHQLKDAFEKIDRQNQDLSRANNRMKRDLDAAARVQQTLLPTKFPDVTGLGFAWSYKPCDELAGDSLNVVRINDDVIAFYLLDVSGHGVPAALLSVAVTRNLQPLAGDAASLVAGGGANPEPVGPADVVARLNDLYPMASNGDHYFTMIYGLLDVRTWRLRFCVAGHPAPVLARKGSSPRRLEVDGYCVGMLPGVTYDETVLDLEPGDRLYLHSDGVTEEVNPQKEDFGDQQLLPVIADGQALPLAASVEAIVQKVVAWRGQDHLRDDVSILALSRD